FPSNWELSSARGVAVVRRLQSLQVQPNRMSVEGHGEYQPVASNNTIEGRQENRRVVISISRKKRIAKLDLNLTDNTTEEVAAQISDGAALPEKEKEPEFKIIRLPGGGILIRGKDSPETKNN
ncbi:MAG: OmpA family protein, partial [Kangiellaceae bacterium]|nr:OmpA family protein [Kangiellaceae bacterium]